MPKLTPRQRALMTKYGITEQQYDRLLRNQKGCCAVCLKLADGFTRRLAVDHNHRTGEVRGLLCYHCNARVVGRHHDPTILERAAAYLRQGTGWFVPKKRRKK